MGTMIPGSSGPQLLLNHPRGLGGWLILTQIGLYFTFLSMAVLTWNSIIPSFQPDVWEVLTSPGSSVYDPLWGPLLIFEAVSNTVFMLLTVYLLVQMYRKKASFPRWMIFFYAGNLLVLIIDYVLLLNIPLAAEFAEAEGSMRDIFRMAGTCAIWIPYFIRSRRVKNTFVN